jgi:signal transduction histidine kinase
MFEEKELQFFVFTALGLFLLLVCFIIFFIRFYYKKQIANAEEKQAMAATFQKELLQSQIEIQEQTLRNISEEIHDNIAQTLSLAKLQLNTVNVEEKSTAIEKVSGSKELVSRAIHDLRQLSKNIHAESVLAAGLVKTISSQLEAIEKAGISKTYLKVTGISTPIDPQKELILFRIVQETLNNSMKHSTANEISVSLHNLENKLSVSVSDNGKGFDPGAAALNGSGLRNIRNRTKLIGGELEIVSGTSGTTLTVTIDNDK